MLKQLVRNWLGLNATPTVAVPSSELLAIVAQWRGWTLDIRRKLARGEYSDSSQAVTHQKLATEANIFEQCADQLEKMANS